MKTTTHTKMVLGQTAAIVGFLGFAVLMFLLRGEIRHSLSVPPGVILMIVSASVAAGTAMIFMKYLGNGSNVAAEGGSRSPERSRRASAPVPAPDRAHEGRGKDGSTSTDTGTVAHGQTGFVRGTPDTIFESTSRRLQREIHALSRRGNLNLTIGVITTAFALGLLAYMIFDESRQSDTFAAALSHYVPRVTTVTFIEVFSFFFLRLYRTSLEEIKFYQNELTSLAGHQIALETSRSTQDPACIRQVLSEIARLDPNAARSPVNGLPSVGATADDANLTNAMNSLDRVSTLVAAGAKAKQAPSFTGATTTVLRQRAGSPNTWQHSTLGSLARCRGRDTGSLPSRP